MLRLCVPCRHVFLRFLEYQRAGQIFKARATREIIVSTGAIGSPQLLMLSGIGEGGHLRAHGLPVVADLPGVGSNLQDHLDIAVHQACTQPVTMYGMGRPHRIVLTALQYLMFGRYTCHPLSLPGVC